MSLLIAKIICILCLFNIYKRQQQHYYCTGLLLTSIKKSTATSKIVPYQSNRFSHVFPNNNNIHHLLATSTDSVVADESTKKQKKGRTKSPKQPEAASIPKKTLVIVESPAKAKTIQKILNSDEYIVESCYGHVRDLCKSVRVTDDEAEDYLRSIVSEKLRIKVGTLGVDVFNDFAPVYVAEDRQATVIERLRKLARGCDLIVLATDEDREGEAISWHLLEVLKPKAPHKRAVFHEITKTAILESFQNLRDIDMNLVQSQETRRILDRLTGYTLSPILWRYISYGMSAGRVQSCGLKLIVDVSSR